MIDATKHMIVAKGKIETSRIDTWAKNPATNKYDIKFTNGRTYSYMMSNVLILSNPSLLNPENYVIRTADGKKLFGAKCIYQFSGGSELYWHIEFNGCAKRPEFWWFVLINFIVSVLVGVVSATLSLVYSLAVLLPSLAVGARRLRDAGFSPWLLVLGLIPVVQLALIVLWIMPSKK